MGWRATVEAMDYKVNKSESEWREQLTSEEFNVLRKSGTERAFSGEYNDTETMGTYACRAYSAELFVSDTKFHSG